MRQDTYGMPSLLRYLTVVLLKDIDDESQMINSILNLSLACIAKDHNYVIIARGTCEVIHILHSQTFSNILDSIPLYYLLLVPRIYFITSIEYASSYKIRYSLPENLLISSYNKETINTYELTSTN